MKTTQQTDTALDIMLAFACETGLDGGAPPRRYLWTDAYAVMNFIALQRLYPEKDTLQHATQLISQVHEVLGRHREDDVRRGWISGLDDSDARQHPTAGGLRIGKPLPERAPHEPYDAHSEWDRDGQYYHYLTKWMYALHLSERATGIEDYGRWARELAEASFNGFVSRESPYQLRWKMSIDLSRPLVAAAGQQDPLDGFVTALTLHEAHPDKELEKIIEALRPFCLDQNWVTDDPLGIGGLLSNAHRLLQIRGTRETADLVQNLSRDALHGLRRFIASPTLAYPATARLAFRELGLSIGLRQIDPARMLASDTDLAAELGQLAENIESFWRDQSNQQQTTWQDHLDINRVMLASSLLMRS